MINQNAIIKAKKIYNCKINKAFINLKVKMI